MFKQLKKIWIQLKNPIQNYWDPDLLHSRNTQRCKKNKFRLNTFDFSCLMRPSLRFFISFVGNMFHTPFCLRVIDALTWVPCSAMMNILYHGYLVLEVVGSGQLISASHTQVALHPPSLHPGRSRFLLYFFAKKITCE